GLPVLVLAQKAVRAAISIIPSTPRLNTPARSITVSPRAANNNGVAVPTAVATTRIRAESCTGFAPFKLLALRATEPKRLASRRYRHANESKQQQQAGKEVCDSARNGGRFHSLATDEENREEN